MNDPNDNAPAGAAEATGRRLPWKLAALLLALAALVAAGRMLDLGALLMRTRAWVESFGPWAPLAFVLLYAAICVAALPGAIFTMAAGAIFGLLEGCLWAWLGAMAGSTLVFLGVRHLARDAVQRRLARDERFRTLDRALGREGRTIMILMRLSPAFPFNFLNYALGLTAVRFVDYLVAGVAMIPGTLLYAYSGYAIGDVALIASGETAGRGTGYSILLALGLAATVAVTVVIARAARQALREAAPEAAAVAGEERPGEVRGSGGEAGPEETA
jgi:uncharacterized membrane protein YdjX (TVP38/TMEM64 family)